jgi:hypothetical protein
MKAMRAALVLAAVLTAALIAEGQATAQKTPAKKPVFPELSPVEKLFYDTVGLHADRKFSQARDKMREATRLAPRNADYREYLSELEGLADQDAIDRQALETPDGAEGDVERLGRHLGSIGRNDRERARAIFRWITSRVAYDAEGLANKRIEDTRAEGVLKSRKTICDGYANLFEKLGKFAGLEVVKIPGHAKPNDFTPGDSFRKDSITHAWNAVKIDGTWRLVDSTWGAGAVNGGRFVPRLNEYYFLTPASQLAFSHFPKEARWQLVNSDPVTEGDFGAWPKFDYRLFQVGVKVATARRRLEANPTGRWVLAYPQPGTKVTILEAPLDYRLDASKNYRIRLKARGFADLAIINGDAKWQRLAEKDGVYEGTFSGKRGDLVLAGRLVHKDNKYVGFLRYAVE